MCHLLETREIRMRQRRCGSVYYMSIYNMTRTAAKMKQTMEEENASVHDHVHVKKIRLARLPPFRSFSFLNVAFFLSSSNLVLTHG